MINVSSDEILVHKFVKRFYNTEYLLGDCANLQLYAAHLVNTISPIELICWLVVFIFLFSYLVRNILISEKYIENRLNEKFENKSTWKLIRITVPQYAFKICALVLPIFLIASFVISSLLIESAGLRGKYLKPESLHSFSVPSLRQSIKKMRAATLFGSNEDSFRVADQANFVYGVRLFQEISSLKFMFCAPLWLEDMQVYISVVRAYHFAKSSVLYVTAFDSSWNELRNGFILYGKQLPLVLPIPFLTGLASFSGPEDPRIFRDGRGHLSVVFNMYNSREHRRIFVFDLQALASPSWVELTAPNSLVWVSRAGQKNWVPLVLGNETFFVYNHQPGLEMLHCEMEFGKCSLLPGRRDEFSVVSDVRGGTPYIPVPVHCYGSLPRNTSRPHQAQDDLSRNTEYFISFVFFHNHDMDQYRPLLTVAYVPFVSSRGMTETTASKALVWRASHAKTIYYSEEMVFPPYEPWVFIPVSIAHWDCLSDSMQLSVNLQDTIDPVLSLEGISPLVKAIIDEHQARERESERPP